MGVRLEHQHGDVKTEPPRQPSGPLQSRPREQQSYVVVPAQGPRVDQQQHGPQGGPAPPVVGLSEPATEDRRATRHPAATNAGPAGSATAAERALDADHVETRHGVLLRGL